MINLPMTLKTFQWLSFVYWRKSQNAYPAIVKSLYFCFQPNFPVCSLFKSITSTMEAILYRLFFECILLPLPGMPFTPSGYLLKCYVFRAQLRDFLYWVVSSLIPFLGRHPSFLFPPFSNTQIELLSFCLE